jgi:GTP-binding protein
LFVNSTRLFDQTYQRYLLNVFREKLPFHDVPIKLYLRSRKQSEPGAHAAPGAGPALDELAEDDSREARADQPAPSRQGSHFDIATRFLNREVNEMLSDLEK